MMDLKHEINILVAIAKMDAALHERQSELSRIPGELTQAERALSALERTEKAAVEAFQQKQKERRALERSLQDSEERVSGYRKQLMQVESNREYHAMQKEIEALTKSIDGTEERLLMLMDELDTHSNEHEDELRKFADGKAAARSKIDELKERAARLEREMAELGSGRPGHLKDLDPALRKRYERIGQNLGSVPVTRVIGESCGGCHTRLPLQLVHEVRKNDQLITCEACGRILVHYSD
jgi:predicted  nucleic acid-binding Zn-ribbon protein